MVHREAFLNMVHGKYAWHGRSPLVKISKYLGLTIKQVRLLKDLGVA
jgi:hypothetical protein